MRAADSPDRTPAEESEAQERARAQAAQADYERQMREKQSAEEIAAIASAAAAVLEIFPEADGDPATIGPRTEWALRLLCAWTFGKAAEADPVMQGLAVMTVDEVIRLTGGR